MMPMNWEEKQTVFINELTLDFIDTIRYINDINRNRHQSQPGVVQNLVNQVISTASAGASLIPGAGSVPGAVGAALSMGWNFSYDQKYEERYACVTADVMQHVDTRIYDEAKKAATLLSRCFQDYLHHKIDPKALKVLADCMADRIMNHMSKVANAETPVSFWSADEFIRGAFEGVSGRWKKTYRNTALETQEEARWYTTLFHHHVSTVEGLMTHTAFATQNEAGEWCYYEHKGTLNPFNKYGLAIFPFDLAKARIESKDRQGKSYRRFEPAAQDITPRSEQMALQWEEVTQPIVLTPTASNETLSAKQVQHEQSLDDLGLRITSLEDVLSTIGISLETLENDFFELKKQHAQNNQELQQFMQQQYREARWKHLNQSVLNEETITSYSLQVRAWLNDIEIETGMSIDSSVEVFARLALMDYTRDLTLDFKPWEAALWNRDEIDLSELENITVPLPIQKVNSTYQWNHPILRDYFLSIGLWQLYEIAQRQPTGESSLLWRQHLFVDFHFERLCGELGALEPGKIYLRKKDNEFLYQTHRMIEPQSLAPHDFSYTFPALIKAWELIQKAVLDSSVDLNKVLRPHQQAFLRLLNERKQLTFVETPLNAFLRQEMPLHLLPALLGDWQQHSDIDTFLSKNIATVFKNHLNTCLCLFCRGKRNLAELTTKDSLETSQARYNIPLPYIRWIRPLDLNSSHPDFHVGFSPEQPEYPDNMVPHLKPVAWHWPEHFLTQYLWEAVKIALEKNDLAAIKTFVALVPASLNERTERFLQDYDEDLLEKQLQDDTIRYIDRMLYLLTLETPEQLDAERLFATYEDAFAVQKTCLKRIQEEAIKAYKDKIKAECSETFLHKVEQWISKVAPLIESYFLSLQDGAYMQDLLPEDARRGPSTDRHNDIIQLVRRHNKSAYKEKGTSRKADLAAVEAAYTRNRKDIKRYTQKLSELSLTTEENVQWDGLKKTEISLLYHTAIQALELRDKIIRNYIQGSSVTQSDFRPDEPRALRVSESLCDRLSDLSHLSIPEEYDFLLNHDFKSTATLLEIWTRYQLFLRQDFLATCKKEYDKTLWAKKGHSYTAYENQLNAKLDSLPSLVPIFKNRIGIETDETLTAELMEWKKKLALQKKALLEKPADFEPNEQRIYHRLSHKIRWEHLLALMPSVFQEAYEQLRVEQKEQLNASLEWGNRQPVIQWFCTVFYKNQGTLFKEECLRKLAHHVAVLIEKSGVILDKNKKAEMNEALEHYRFKEAFECLPKESCDIFSAYTSFIAKCEALLNEFRDTHTFWTRKTPAQRKLFLSALWQGNPTLWETFLTEMQGQWYPLTHALFQQFLGQGLHPDAKKHLTLLDMTIQTLPFSKQTQEWQWSAVPRQLDRIYYLLDGGAVTPNWTTLLDKTSQAYANTATLYQHHLFHLSATLILFQKKQENPAEAKKLLEAIQKVRASLKQYSDTFKEEETSLWQLFWRKQAVRKNRVDTIKDLAAYLNNIDINMAHFYHFFHLLQELIDAHQRQTPLNFSRSKKLLLESQRILEDFLTNLNVLETMKAKIDPRLSETRQIYANAAGASVVSMGDTLQVIPTTLTHFSDASVEEPLRQVDESFEKWSEEAKKAVEEKKEEAETAETEVEKLRRENQALRDENNQLKRRREQQNDNQPKERPSSRYWCTLS